MGYLKYSILILSILLSLISCNKSPSPVNTGSSPVTKSAASPAGQLVEVQQGNIEITISASGNLNMPNKNKLIFGTSGMVKQVNVKKGDQVTKGQLVAKLDTTSLEISIAQAQINLKNAENTLIYYSTDEINEEIKAQANIKEAQVNLDNAMKALDEVRNHKNIDLIKQQAVVANAEATVESAKKNVEMPYDAVDIAKQESAVAEARVNSDTAIKALDEANKQDNSIEIIKQRAAIAEAENALKTARDNLEKARSPDADLNIVKESLAAGRIGLAQTRSSIERGGYPYNVNEIVQAQVYIGVLINDLNKAQRVLTKAANITTVSGSPNDIRSRATDLATVQTAVVNIQTNVNGLQNSMVISIPAKKQMVESGQAAFVYAQNLYLEKNINATQLQSYITALQQNKQSLDAETQSVTATLDQTRDNIDNLDYQLSQIQVDLADIMQRSDPLGISSKETQIAKAQANLAEALKKLEDLRDPLYILTKEKDVAKAQAALADARKKLQDMKTGGTVVELKTKEALLIKAQADLAEALKKLEDLKEPNYITTKEKEIAKAQVALADAQKRLKDIKSGIIASDIEVKKAQVNYARLVLDKMNRDLNNATLTAPINGFVADVTAQEGVPISGEAVAVLLVDLSEIEMNIAVIEIDMPKIKIGQPARIRLDALPNIRLDGIVRSVSPVGKIQSGMLTYDVVISVEAPLNIELRSDMTAAAVITVEKKSNALLLPSQAIITDISGKPVVQVLSGEQKQEKEITTGISDGSRTEIVNGLGKGDKVILTPSRLRTQ